MSDIYKIYKLTLPNGKAYVGMTKQALQKRWENGNGYKYSTIFTQAIMECGWRNIQKEVLAMAEDKDKAEELEMFYIAKYKLTDSRYGYNIDNGGNRKGTHSESTKKKISDANRGKIVSEETKRKMKERSPRLAGEKNGFYGKHHTEKTKQKQSQMMKGNQYFKGHHHSEEFKKNKSEQMRKIYANGGNPRCKAVQIISENGLKIEEYCSLSDAARKNKISLSKACNLINKSIVKDGKTWRYKDA